ncbi:MAG: hypothetical protein NC915_04755 [Candidatus Omnitrophica bacterium]|nr:hypothetical protein [Candidatus Omnitrophota bacterium]
MKNIFLFFIIFVGLYSEEIVKIIDLYEKEDYYDGKIVIIQGEVIGEKIGNKENIWINLKDDAYLIGIFVNKKEVEKIENYGKYKVKGDIVRIKGIYNKFCNQHYGKRDIHVLELEVISKGIKYKEEVDLYKILTSFIMLFITVFIIFYYHKTSPIK